MKIVYKRNGQNVDRNGFLSGQKSLDEILETRQFPGLNTDDTFMRGRGTLADQLGEQTNEIVAAAQRNGYTPSYSDVYLPGVARFPGDPEAFVKHASAKGSVRRTLEQRGWGCEGSVKVKAREAEESEPVKLADDLVEEYATEIRARDSHARKANPKELKQEIIKKFGSK